MSNFNPMMLTAKGISLLTRAQAGEANIVFTKFSIGDGSYVAGESTYDATALKSQKQETEITSKAITGNNTVALKGVIRNRDLQEGYYVKEIGVYAEDPDEGEILYAIATAIENEWDFFPPAYNNDLASCIFLECNVAVGNAKQVKVVIQDGSYASAKDMIDVNERIDELEENLDAIDEITPDEVTELWGGSVGEIPEIPPVTGIISHTSLSDRDAADQHPITAISGIEEASEEEIERIWGEKS